MKGDRMMDYNKKLKIRLISYIAYTAIGILMMVVSLAGIARNEFLSPLGFAFTLMGAVRIGRYQYLLKNPQALNRRKIAETDERNIMIWTQARSLAFIVFIMLSGIAVIVLQMMNRKVESNIVAYMLMFFVAIYWICYAICKRKY